MANASDFKVKQGLQVEGGDVNLGGGTTAGLLQVDARTSGVGLDLTISSGESSAGGNVGGKIIFQTAAANSLTQAAEINKSGNLTMNDKVISGMTNLTASSSGVATGNDLASLYRIRMPSASRAVTPQNNEAFIFNIGGTTSTIDTAQNGTAADYWIANLDPGLIKASNTGTTITDATTLHISGAPAIFGSGTVPTITNAYALQVSAGTSLFSGPLKATGTSTLSTVDIGAGAIDGTTIGATSATTGAFSTLSATGAVTVGVDGTGADVTFHSDTAGDNMLWDTSAKQLKITGTASSVALDIDTGNFTVGAYGLTDGGAATIASMAGNWTNAGRTVADLGTITTVDINGGTVDGATIATSDVTVGSGKTLNVSAGTLTTSSAQKLAIVQGVGAATDIGGYDLRALSFTSDIASNVGPPFAVTSTANVANLNASSLSGATMAAPGAIGGTTASAGTFSTLTGTSLDVNGAADISGDLTLSAGGDGALRFSAASSIKILNNNSAALVIEEADSAYMTFVTTDDGEKVSINKKLEARESLFDTSMTLGIGAQADMLIKFDGVQNFHLGIDDSADEFVLGGAHTAGSATAIKFNTSGEVTKIGQDTPTDGQFLKWDNNTGVVTWDAQSGVATSLMANDLLTGDAAVNIVTTLGNITLDAQATDADIIFIVDDDATPVTALTLDGSDAGNATFVNKIIAVELDISGDIDVDGITNLDNTDIDGTLTVDGSAVDINATTTCAIDNSNTTNGLTLNTATSGSPVSIGHSVSETTINDNLSVTGDLTVSGTTTTVNSTVVSIADPIFELGANASEDNLDRGIKMKWHNGSAAKVAFMGYDDSTGKFVVIADATESSNLFSGTASTMVANLDGTVNTATQGSITTAANLTTVGALNAGSITSGFTSIDVGAGAITTSGTLTGGGIVGTSLTMSDRVTIASTSVIDTYKATLSTTNATTMFTLASDTYSAGKVLVSVWREDSSSDDHRSVTEFIFTYQGASTPTATGNIHMTEYGIVDTSGSQLATFDVVKSVGNILVQLTPLSDDQTKVRAQITQFLI